MVLDRLFTRTPLVLAIVIVWRAPRYWFAWYSAFILLFIAEYALNNPIYAARLLPPALYDINAVCWPLVLLYFFFFPNGRPVPRRALWLVVPLSSFHLAFQGAGALLRSVSIPLVIEQFFFDLFLPVVGLEAFLILAFQVYRYRRASSPLEKQQTQWVLLGLAIFSL